MTLSSRPPITPRTDLGIARGKRVVFQPQVTAAMINGADTIVNAIRPTLGPMARTVLIERGIGPGVAPDVLHDGATIGRRLLELPNADADVGAMLLRHALWRVAEHAGDAVATTAVLFQEIVKRVRLVMAADGNVMQMRDGLMRAADAVCDAIDSYTEPFDSDAEFVRKWLTAHCDDVALTDTLAQILSSNTADTTVQVENSHTQHTTHQFITGAFWRTGWHASPFAAGEYAENQMLRLPDARVLVSDLDLSDQRHMEPLIMTLAQLRPARLMVVCRNISPQLATLFVEARQQKIGDALLVKVPASSGADRMAMLLDMAVLTGATFIPHFDAGESGASAVRLEDLLPSCLGRAQCAWASADFAGIEGGMGDQAVQIEHIRRLDEALNSEDDPARIRFYQERMTTFGGGVVRLMVGAPTESEQKQRKAQAERLSRLVTHVSRYGVVPGAGKCLMLCEKAAHRVVESLAQPDARYGAECLLHALSAPMRVIAENAGLSGAVIAQRNRTSRRDWAVDVRTGKTVNLRSAGIMDAAYALQLAVRAAVSSAALFMTTDVIVHRRQTETAIKP